MADRQQQGQLIAEAKGLVKRVDDKNYVVTSQSGNGSYNVQVNELGFVCSCPDHLYRGVKCKNIHAVEISFAIRKEVEIRKIQPVTNIQCIYCKSPDITKGGLRHNKHGDIQKFNCKDCRKYFTINIGFEKMKHNPQGITTAMQLYFSGESSRKTAESLKLIGMDVTHQTIYNWIRKYIGLMQKYLDKIKPNVG